MQKAQLFFNVDNCIIGALIISPPKSAESSQLLSTSKRTDSRIRASTWIFSAQNQILPAATFLLSFASRNRQCRCTSLFVWDTGKMLHFTVIAKLQFDHMCSAIPFSWSAFQYCPTIHEASLLVRRQTEAQPPIVTIFGEQLSQPNDLAQSKVYVSKRKSFYPVETRKKITN